MTPTSEATANRLTMAITELDFGGAERAFVQIAIGLKSRGWDVNVISLRDAGVLAEPLRQVGIPVDALHCGGPADFRAIGRMKHALQKHPPAVLLTFLHQANIVGRMAAERANVKTVICGVRVADRRWSVRIPEFLTKNRVTHYVAVSKSVARIHCDICGIAKKNMMSIYNGVDLLGIDAAIPVTRREIHCGENDQIILCVGRLTQQKSPLDVVEAFDKLRQLDPAGHQHRKLVFIGDGPLKPALLASIQKRQLERHVHLLGWRLDVASVMKAATVLVVASKWEGLPNVVLEAQAARLPVIASAVDGCQEIIQDRVTGRLFPSGDITALASVLRELLGSVHGSNAAAEQPRSRIAASAREFVESRFSWEKCVEEYDELLRNLQSGQT